MKIADVTRGERGFTITWDDRFVTEFPFIWLRDNDRDELHPETRERVFDLTSVDLDISPDSFELGTGELIVRWPKKPNPSIYPMEWLHAHLTGDIFEQGYLRDRLGFAQYIELEKVGNGYPPPEDFEKALALLDLPLTRSAKRLLDSAKGLEQRRRYGDAWTPRVSQSCLPRRRSARDSVLDRCRTRNWWLRLLRR